MRRPPRSPAVSSGTAEPLPSDWRLGQEGFDRSEVPRTQHKAPRPPPDEGGERRNADVCRQISCQNKTLRQRHRRRWSPPDVRPTLARHISAPPGKQAKQLPSWVNRQPDGSCPPGGFPCHHLHGAHIEDRQTKAPIRQQNGREPVAAITARL